MWQQALFLATEGVEGVSPDHIAAKIALPLGLIFFCGSVYLLLWSNFGARKGALIYGNAFFGFCFMIGIFWWFGAPGTPIATGLQNFPGQNPTTYASHWYTFEPGSERAGSFPASNSLDGFQSPAEFLGKQGMSQEQLESDPMYADLVGDLSQAGDQMIALYLRRDASGETRIGGSLRTEYQDAGAEALAAAVDNPDDYKRANPFFTAQFQDGVKIRMDQGVRLAGGEITVIANYEPRNAESAAEPQAFPVDTVTMYAFQEPSRIWFPSAVWTIISLIGFALCVFGLDRIERREKREAAEVEEPESLAVPIRQ
jgi:hypothetical protein